MTKPIKVRDVKDVIKLMKEGKTDVPIDTSFINYHCTSIDFFKLDCLFERDFDDLEVINHNLYLYGPNAVKVLLKLTEGIDIDNLPIVLPSEDTLVYKLIQEQLDIDFKKINSKRLFVLVQEDYEAYSDINKKAVDELIKTSRARNLGVIICAKHKINKALANNCQSIYLTDKNEDYLQFSPNQKIYQGELKDRELD